jgi:hypothetical protein
LDAGDEARRRMGDFGLVGEDDRRRPAAPGGAGLAGTVVGGAVAAVGQRVRELMSRTRNPLEQGLKALSQYKEMKNWSFEKRYKVRMAKDYVASAFQNGTCRDYVWNYLQQRELVQCNGARTLVSIGDIITSFIMQDLEECPGIINTEGFERLCKWAAGLEKVYEHCRVAADHKDAKKGKCRWYLLEQYHPSARDSSGFRSDEQEEQVASNLKEEAIMDKYLEKAKSRVGPDGLPLG